MLEIKCKEYQCINTNGKKTNAQKTNIQKTNAWKTNAINLYNIWNIIENTKYGIQCIEKKQLNTIHKLQCTVCYAQNTNSLIQVHENKSTE